MIFSANWKNLQARIQAESTSLASTRLKRERASTSEGSQSPTCSKRRRNSPSTTAATTTTTVTSRPRFATHTNTSTRAKLPPSSGARCVSLGTGIMGNTQSAAAGDKPPTSPGLALWAEDKKDKSSSASSPKSSPSPSTPTEQDKTQQQLATEVRPNAGLTPGLKVGKYIALDCEMVGVGTSGRRSALARVSIVDWHGVQVYDSFVRPTEPVTDWRTEVSGVSAAHMAKARDFYRVQDEVRRLCSGRLVVGHGLHNDMHALKLKIPSRATRDTAHLPVLKEQFGNGGSPRLKTLAKETLGLDVQTGAHSSVEDARTAMLLFRRYKPQFDAHHGAHEPSSRSHKSTKEVDANDVTKAAATPDKSGSHVHVSEEMSKNKKSSGQKKSRKRKHKKKA